MAELKVDEAKKDLDNMMQKSRVDFQKGKESTMSEEERKKADEAKAEAEKKRKEAEDQAKKDAELIKKKDEELDEEAKKQKAELLEKQKQDEEARLSSEDKIKRIKEETQKRIDSITNELKQIKDTSSKETEELRQRLTILQEEKQTLEKKLTPASAQDELMSVVEKAESERIDKYVKDDEKLSREKRREMTKEEIDEWLVEDLGAAQQWLTRREIRRYRERERDMYAKGQERQVKAIMEKQEQSSKRAYIRHPDLNVDERKKQLATEGKSDSEIQAILCQENKKHKICSDLLAKNPKRYMSAENGPELLVEDMEKALNKEANQEPNPLQKQLEDMEKRIQDLTAQLQQKELGDEGINSNSSRQRTFDELTPAQQQFIKTARETGLPQAKIDARLKQMRVQGK